MRTFIATIYNPAGDESIVKLKGDTQESVRKHLRQEGYTIKKIVEQENQGLWQTLQNIEVGQRIKPQNRLRLLRTMGQMIGRGYVLEAIIDFLLADEKEKDVKKLLIILQKKAQKGYKDYVELFREAEDYFEPEFFSILVAGQKTGTVGSNIMDYAEGKAKLLEQKGYLVKTLSGKFVVLGVVCAAFLVIVLFVVPQFTKLFGDALELPLGMQVMVFLSDLFRNYSVLVFGSSIGLVALLISLYKFHLGFRFTIQHLLLKSPVLGDLLRMIHTRDFLYMMGNLMSKGVALMEAIRIVIEQTRNLCFRSVYEAIEANLEKGRKLEQVLKPLDPQLIKSGLYVAVPSGYLLDSVAQAMTLGSKGGNLGELLFEAYMTYDFQLQNRMNLSIKILGAAISIFTYLVIIFMIGSLAATLFKVMKDPTAVVHLFQHWSHSLIS